MASHKLQYLGQGCSWSTLYVNDITKCVTQGKLHLHVPVYEHDTTAFVIGDNPDDVII